MSVAPALKTTTATDTATPKRGINFDSRFVAPILITFILLVAHMNFGILEEYPKTLLAIGVSVLTELILGRLFTGKWPHLASAYISGISCGILVRSPEWWPYAAAAAISITSKYVIRVKGRHLWNPSNLGIACLLFLAPQTVASLSIQWGNNLAAMAVIWLLGGFIVSRLGRLHIVATYVSAFVALALFRAFLGGSEAGLLPRFYAEIAPITGPMYQLFIFFMITDPKTTTGPKWAQMVVVFSVAVMECILRLRGDMYAIHAPYYALFLVGPAANLIEIGLTELEKRKAQGAIPAKEAVGAA
jgi:Na+-transporting NADH:ubiquinone oxidoreductase subunit NqrB